MTDFCELCDNLIDDIGYIDSGTRERLCSECKHEQDAELFENEDIGVNIDWYEDSVDNVLDTMDEDEMLTDLALNKIVNIDWEE